MRYTNKTGLPEPVVKALTEFEKPQNVEGIRVTTLIDSPRISILRKQHSKDLTEDVSDLVYRIMGTAIHTVFENAASNSYVSEERLEHEVEGHVISGQVDLQFEDDDCVDLKDFKSTSVYKVMMDSHPDWEKQLNVYAYLVRHSKGLRVRNASVIAILRDWRKADAERKEGYPPAPIVELEVPLWSEEEQDQFVLERVMLHSKAEIDNEFEILAECTDEERWARPAKFAVHKGKNVRALRVFDTMKEAENFASEDAVRRIEERPATFVRCENYCVVNKFCNQWSA
tara:strand:- start:2811 stop:3665 length:855 start_codon:yes stop_codon:yes gene_type:complete